MSIIHKCPALKHGVAVTSITDKFYYGTVQPCCPSANSKVSQEPRTDILTPAQKFFANQVNIPIHDENPKYGIDSFDEIFTKHRDWVDEDGYVDDIVCDWCVDGAANMKDNRLPYTDYTPEDTCHNPVSDTDSKGLVFLGPLLLESTCNFSCYVCGSGNSTQWASIAKPIKEDLENANLTANNDEHIDKWYNADHLSLNKSYSKKIKEVLYNTDMSAVQFVHLVGGEPLYGKMFPWFLELLDSRIDLSNVVLTFNTNVSIFPDEKILNILRKFKEVRVSLSLDGVGPLQVTTRPGVSWEEINSNVEKWVAFRNTTSIGGSGHKFDNPVEYSILLFIGTTLSVLNVNKIGSILDYIIEKDLWPSQTLLPYPQKYQMQLNPLILTFVQFKPYLDINLIPIEIRKNWIIDKNDYSEIYHLSIDEYNKSILYNTNNNGTVDKCLAYLSIVEKATNTKFSDANPEMYECLQKLDKQNLPKICTAPFSSVLIDINKNIKPCNQYAEGPMMRDSQEEFTRDEFVPGNLNDSTLQDVLNNNQYKELRENMHDGIVPKGCEWCLQREKETGFSQRQAFMPPGAETYSNNKNTSYNGRLYYEDWHKGITVLELDTSNICNLTCAGCDSFFSSMWKTIEDTIEPDDNNRFYMHDKPYRNVPYEFHIGDKLISELAGVNLSYLKRVIYKGGEPFLNKDMIVSLRYFDRIGILPNLTIGITTNGTVVNPLITRLLDRAKRVEIVLSVDGGDEVNRYIRHSPTNLSSTVNLINFCNQFHNSSRYHISMMPTIMVYNIFSLDKLLDWWLFEMKPRYDNAGIKTLSPTFHSSHFLRNKAWLTLRTLQPHTIKQLIKYYEEKSKDPKYKNINKNSHIKSHSNPFENLIYVLKNTEYGGDMLHDQMVKYTKDMDAIKGQNVLDAVPELKKEMVYLTVKHHGAHEVKLQERKYTRLEIFYNKIKQRFANNKTYVTDLGSIRNPK